VHRHLIALLIVLSILSIGLSADAGLPLAFGFDVTVPAVLPIDWDTSFSFIAMEFMPDPNLTILFTLGTYPSHFPQMFEGIADFMVKSWLGPVAVYAGGGLDLQWRYVGDTWWGVPYMHIMAGTQIWIIDSVAVVAGLRSLDTIAPMWHFSPEVSLGLRFSLSPPRPEVLGKENAFYLWVVVGLIVAGILAYYPHS